MQTADESLTYWMYWNDEAVTEAHESIWSSSHLTNFFSIRALQLAVTATAIVSFLCEMWMLFQGMENGEKTLNVVQIKEFPRTIDREKETLVSWIKETTTSYRHSI